MLITKFGVAQSLIDSVTSVVSLRMVSAVAVREKMGHFM